MAGTFTLDRDGYFAHQGRRILPVGVNYWPASSGVEMWQRWAPDEIKRDLDLLPAHGLNTIRFFLRWQDFEPSAGEYDRRQFDRLAALLGWCRDRGIWAHPSLFVGWMSGGIFWPSWRQERNVFADPFMRERAVAFAGETARVIAPFADGVLAIDQGNELCCLPDSVAAPPADVIQWCGGVSAAIRQVWPEALIISGNEQSQVIADTGWRLGQQPGCDLYSMHAYPVPNWHSMRFDGMTDPLCQSLLPFYVKMARAFGPVFVQEFGTIVTFGRRQQERYLRAMLPSAWEAGANGFLWWCARDIAANVTPYTTNGFEQTLGLFNADGHVKSGLEYFLEFARGLSTAAPPKRHADVGLYMPQQYYDRDLPLAGNHPREMGSRLTIANYLLQTAGRLTRVIRGPIDDALDLSALVIPGAVVSVPEIEALSRWVKCGGKLLWHGPDPVNWGAACVELLGARPVDYRHCNGGQVGLFDELWDISAVLRNMPVQVELDAAECIATGVSNGLPAVIRNRLGNGSVVACLGIPEQAALRDSGNPAQRDRWANWYRGMLDLLEA